MLAFPCGREECAMLSKCANPECSELFRYLRQGKIFRLTPSPTVQAAAAALGSQLTERFWLCDLCSQKMTMIWDGARATIVPLPQRVAQVGIPELKIPQKGPQRSGAQAAWERTASAGRDDY
jgi:hypothetical protein